MEIYVFVLKEFQSLLEAADQDRANSAVAIERTNKLRKLCEDFATAAKQHAITIVSEMFCDKVQYLCWKKTKTKQTKDADSQKLLMYIWSR